MAQTATPETVAATVGPVTVTLTAMPGHPGYWIQTQAEDGDEWGDALVTYLREETPQAYAQRWAELYAN